MSSINILIVDDELEVAEALTFVLPIEWESTICIDPLEVKKILEQEKFDLIITDLQMPKLSGLELVKTLRSQNIQIPIFISTGFSKSDSTVQEALNAGAQGVIPKPFLDMAAVIHEIETYFQKIINTAGC